MNEKNIFKLISRLLIAFGVLTVNLIIFTVLGQFIGQIFFKVDVGQLISHPTMVNATHNQISALRWFFAIYSIGTFLFTSFILALIFKQKPLDYLGLSSLPKPIYLLIVPLLFVVFVPALSWIIQWNSAWVLPDFLSGLQQILWALEDENNQLYKLLLGMNNYTDLCINIMVMALIPALGEELFCRGVLLNILYDYSGKIFLSILIVAIIFTMLHMQFFKVVPMMSLAILLGLFINWTQSIWASILFHFLNNSLAVVGSFYYQRGVKNIFTDEQANIPLYLTIISFIFTIAIVLWLNKFAKHNLIKTNE